MNKRTAVDRSVGITRPGEVAAAVLILVATWGLSHHYKGVTLDGDLYAFQAMARLHPWLRADLYFMATSQDQFTLFSPIYALFIRCFGLWSASAALFAMCAATFLTGAWAIAQTLWNDDRVWLALVACIVIVGGYGAYSIFTYAENYLTARSMAEAMVVLALACHLRGRRWLSWIIVVASMLIHPLMALPGCFLLIILSVPLWYAALAALVGIVAELLFAWLALHTTHGPHLMNLMGGDWLGIVQERSQFLFLQFWHLRDWESNTSPILSLVITAIVADDSRVRRLCIGAIMIGTTGLLVALIACSIGPVAILIQGQAWRWFWVAAFISILTLAPTTLRLWTTDGAGAVCAALLVASWTVFRIDGTVLAAAALCILLARRLLKSRIQQLMRILAYAMVAAILAWMVAKTWSVCTPHPAVSIKKILLIEQLRSVYALQIPAMVFAWLGFRWLRSGPNFYASLVACLLLLSLCYLTLTGSFTNNSTVGTTAEIQSLSSWRETIPATSNVLVLPGATSAAPIWFSLQRPSYLTTDQSAGVVFSPETAQEVRRRSEVLLPVMQPDWKINTQLARAATARKPPSKEPLKTSPLTAEQLSSICRDQALGFVIAKERLGFDANHNNEPGRWQDWNLYDCARVRKESVGDSQEDLSLDRK